MKTRGQAAMEKRLKEEEEQAAKDEAAEEITARQKADDDDDSKLMEKIKKHKYYQYVLNYKSMENPNIKMLIIMTAGDLDGMKRIKIIKVLGNQKIFPSLAKKTLKKLYELIDDDIIILKEKD